MKPFFTGYPVDNEGDDGYYLLNTQYMDDSQEWYQNTIMEDISNSRECKDGYQYEITQLYQPTKMVRPGFYLVPVQVLKVKPTFTTPTLKRNLSGRSFKIVLANSKGSLGLKAGRGKFLPQFHSAIRTFKLKHF